MKQKVEAGHAPFKDLSEQQPTEVLVQPMMQVCLATTPKQQPKIGNASTPSWSEEANDEGGVIRPRSPRSEDEGLLFGFLAPGSHRLRC